MSNLSKIRPMEPCGCSRYRDKAFECLRALADMSDPAGRLDLLQVAQHWLSLAEHVGRRTQRTGPEVPDIASSRHGGPTGCDGGASVDATSAVAQVPGPAQSLSSKGGRPQGEAGKFAHRVRAA